MSSSTFRRVLIGAAFSSTIILAISPAKLLAGNIITLQPSAVTANNTDNGPIQSFVNVDNANPPESYTINLSPNETPAQKASDIAGHLSGHGSFKNAIVTPTTDKDGNPIVKIVGLTLPAGELLSYQIGNTGEMKDKWITSDPLTHALIFFNNTSFNPTAADGSSAVFTAGIISNAGEFDAQVSASSLANTDGTTIVAALYAQLEPEAATYGATITNMGVYMAIQFDPSMTTNQGGIAFGTTSLTPGCQGCITPQSIPEPCSLLMAGTAALAGLALWARGRFAPSRVRAC
jgi:hypothetical protein